MEKHPRILIVGTQPYNPTVQSRAFDSYFHFWEKENLRQIFSDSRTPCKGHCGQLYQITDKRLLKNILTNKDSGVIFDYDGLPEKWNEEQKKQSFAPKKKTALWKFIRKHLWAKRRWAKPSLLNWVEEFKPEAVFIAFSRDFFIFDIALYFADKYNIPVIASIADDFVFDQIKTHDLLQLRYRKQYTALMDKLFHKENIYCIFESRKIQEKYEREYNVKSNIQYISTSLKPAKEATIPKEIRDFKYFGNLECGRFQSLLDIGYAIDELDEKATLSVYSKDSSSTNKASSFPKCMKIFDAIPYDEVIAKTKEADVNLIVESFEPAYVNEVRYSLSTKVADVLSIGKPVLAYGDLETGAIGFLKEKECAIIADSKTKLKEVLRALFSNPISAKATIEKGLEVCKKCFNLEEQAQKFSQYVREIVNKNQ